MTLKFGTRVALKYQAFMRQILVRYLRDQK
jgi:hypothetical protein